MVPYAAVKWLIKGRRTPNDLRVWLEGITITDGNFQKEDWELFLEFTMAAVQMDKNNKKNSFLAMEVEPVTITDPKFWKWEDQLLDATLGTRPERYPVANRGGTSQIDN